eukprot:365443-Chlamydomonas_euryale.AAC.3
MHKRKRAADGGCEQRNPSQGGHEASVAHAAGGKAPDAGTFNGEFVVSSHTTLGSRLAIRCALLVDGKDVHPVVERLVLVPSTGARLAVVVAHHECDQVAELVRPVLRCGGVRCEAGRVALHITCAKAAAGKIGAASLRGLAPAPLPHF